jgi:hypothetical protein
MRRFTRLTYAFSKMVENLAASVALFLMFYNFGRPLIRSARTQRTPWLPGLRITFGCEEIAALLD